MAPRRDAAEEVSCERQICSSGAATALLAETCRVPCPGPPGIEHETLINALAGGISRDSKGSGLMLNQDLVVSYY
jgi:hypothetical protein